ncbi:hypothetical protein [Saccharothrix sp. HUAS TT1]|uniref:hypothetical protein n=1 Tax=unclassified Saccharothrix TaxID=2593673 RepID=UPI00345BB98A
MVEQAVDTTKVLVERLRAVGLTSASVPALHASFNRSDMLIDRARVQLHSAVQDSEVNVDVVGFGSLARREFTSESDLDYLVVTYGLDPHPGSARRMLQHTDSLRFTLFEDNEVRPPGATGVFGRVTSASDMVERIGLEDDTNHSHTRRILLLEESVSLFQPERHRQLLDSMIDRYLFGRVRGKESVPRFLLNDIVRYWRTIAVDYQAKSFGSTLYSLRYLKLLISRKITFAASLVPLLECLNVDHNNVAQHLSTAYTEPSILRLLRLAPWLDDEATELLRSSVTLADKFIEKLGDAQWRSTIADECSRSDPTTEPEFGLVRQWGKDLQVNLQKIFMSPKIIHFTERYLLF